MTEQRQRRQPVIVTSDAGGTMTDIFAIDEEGEFVVGKAPSTPHDSSVGFMASLEDALSGWGYDGDGMHDALAPTRVAIFSGTMMINTLLSRSGRRIGLIITRGFEDYSIMERARQTYAGYSYSDRLHGVTHQSNPPLVQRHHTRGVTERVDMFGDVVVPLYEDEVRRGVEELLAQDVEGIAICFLFSHVNPAHELRAKELAQEVLNAAGSDIPVHVSHEVAPVMREYSRLNSVLIEAYAADPARWHLERCEEGLHDRGFKPGLLTVIASGGLVPVSHDRLYETVISGPVGGLFGAKYVADELGLENVITSDLGGTSFDVGLLSAGQLPIIREPEVGNFWLNLPMVELRTIGAGAGSYLKVNELTGRVEIGPESAGADPGPACYGMGNDKPTILDCNVITGIIDPANYLGGQVEIFPEKALDSIRRYVSEPLGIDPHVAAEGMIDLLNSRAQETIRGLVTAKGFDPSEYTLMSYGGAGPMHAAGYTDGLGLKGVLTFPFAAGFSSFGCACLDYARRQHRSTLMVLPPGAGAAEKQQMRDQLNEAWASLAGELRDELVRDGIDESTIELTSIAFLRYGGQLDDLPVAARKQSLESVEDVDALIADFEDLYSRTYASAGSYPEGGFQVFEVAVVASVPQIKPRLPKRPSEPNPSPEPRTSRQVFHSGAWRPAAIYDMDDLKPGWLVRGLAIVEASNTTLVVPPGHVIDVDEYGFQWLRKED